MEQINHYLKVDIEIEESKWGFMEEDLFKVVMRKNKKRHFLFASTVIGKYIAVHPYRPIMMSSILAAAFCEAVEGYMPDEIKDLLNYWKVPPTQEEFNAFLNKSYPLKKKTLFIGFAETATGLGQGVFRTFKENCAYIHTTRAQLVNEKADFIFKEEHSHAVGHNCYVRELEDLKSFERVVLVDDEITTGNTALNLIRAIKETLDIKEFAVLSLLDWRGEKDQRKFEALEAELDLSITCVSLLKGSLTTTLIADMDKIVLNNEQIEWDYVDKMAYLEAESQKIEENYETLYFSLDGVKKYLTYGSDEKIRTLQYMRKVTGRFGITIEENHQLDRRLEKIGAYLKEKRSNAHTLCLGTEEFIYIPNRIAAAMGEGVWFACSARSPIITMDEADYSLKDGLCFKSPEDQGLSIYLYNMNHQGYEEVFWFLEREVPTEFKAAMSRALGARGIKKVYFVILSDVES